MHERAAQFVKAQLGGQAMELFSTLLKSRPQLADAVIFLQGDQLDRAQKVVGLYRNGFAPRVLITGNNDLIGRGKRNEENDYHLDMLKTALTENHIPEDAIAVDSSSMNTKEQAIFAIDWAQKQKYKKMLVVTSPFHILRAYLTFLKQINDKKWNGEIVMQAADLPWESAPGGRKRTALKMLLIELEKIKKYRSDLASIDEGLSRAGR
jgi:uncharacterized SAM-binding protein YcdF (DUF218 family)